MMQRGEGSVWFCPLSRDCRSRDEHGVRPGMLGIPLDCNSSPRHALSVSAGGEVCIHHSERGITADQAIARAQPECIFGVMDCFLVPALNGYREAKQAVRQREIRVQL